MYYLIYTSTAKPTVDEVELYDILATSIRNNRKLDVTGLLIYHSGTFIQMLEGSRENVLQIYEAIKQDPRHFNVEQLISDVTDKRHFGEWHMALEVVHKKTFEEIPAYQHLEQSSAFLMGMNHDHLGIRLLGYFHQTYLTNPPKATQ